MNQTVLHINELLSLVDAKNYRKAMSILQKIVSSDSPTECLSTVEFESNSRFIISVAASIFEVDEKLLSMSCRKIEVVWARSLCYVYFRDECKMSYQQIGSLFNKNHATVIHGYNGFKELLEFDEQAQDYYAMFVRIISTKSKNTVIQQHDEQQAIQH